MSISPADFAVRPLLPDPGPGGARDPVLMRKVDLPGVLHGDDLGPWRNEQGDGVEGGGLARGGAAADDHRLAILHAQPEVGDHFRAGGLGLHQVHRRERLVLEPPDGEGRAPGGDLSRVGGLDTVTFRRRPVQYGAGHRDLLAAPLPQRDDIGVEGVLVVEDQGGLQAAVLAMVHEDRYADAIAGDVLDVLVPHQDVDLAVADEIADDVIDRSSSWRVGLILTPRLRMKELHALGQSTTSCPVR